MSDEYTITTRSEGLLGKVGQWGAALITDEELLEALAAHDAEVRADSAEAHERTKRGAKTLGEIVVRQVEDTLRWAGMEDQIGTDDPDQQLAWERCAEMPGRIAELEAELAEVRAGVVIEEPEWEYGWHTGSTVSLIGRRDQVEEWLAVRGWRLGEGDWGSRVMRRRVAGSWVPAEQEGAETDA